MLHPQEGQAGSVLGRLQRRSCWFCGNIYQAKGQGLEVEILVVYGHTFTLFLPKIRIIIRVIYVTREVEIEVTVHEPKQRLLVTKWKDLIPTQSLSQNLDLVYPSLGAFPFVQ